MTGEFLVNWFAEWEGKHDQFYAYADMYQEAVLTITNAMNSNFNVDSLDSSDQHPAALAFHDYGIIPVMYLFRHYIELQLKGLILHKSKNFEEIVNEHRIQALLDLLSKYSDIPRISKQCKKIIVELCKLDRTSQGFRYPYGKDGSRFFQETSEEELKQINAMEEFVNRINIVFRDLENQEGDFIAEDEIESFD